MEIFILWYIVGVLLAAALGLGYYSWLPESRKRPKSEKRIATSSLLSWIMVCIVLVFVIDEIHVKLTRNN